MKKHVLFTLTLALAATVLISCDKSDDPEDITPEETVTPEEDFFASGPLTLTSTQQEVDAADKTFAMKLLSEMDSRYADDGYLFSPISISTALSMLLNGTQGETAKEIIDAIGYGDNIDAVNDYFNQILSKSASWDSTVILSTANALVSNKNKNMKQSYAETLKTVFNANASSFDFSKSDSVLNYINGWCNEKTHGMIPQILDGVSESALMYIMNAIYFKGGWSNGFEKEKTGSRNFTKDNGTTTVVPMMNKTGILNYSRLDGMSLLELPYGNGSFAFQVLLPDYGTNARALASINEAGWNRLFSGLSKATVSVYLPKFKVEQGKPYDMIPIANSLGMKKMFLASSDFSPITDESYQVSKILHKTGLSIDEDGSEAAAVTIIGLDGINPDASQAKQNEFLADHSFYYAIVDKANGLILFMGKYNG